MKEVILDTFIDSIKLIPFLFIAFLIIEFLEHKINKKSLKLVSKSDKYGPLLGSIFGLFPQCGFSVLATNLYTTRIITLGSLIAIYLSTSDEMLPIMLSSNISISLVIKILLIKFLVGFLCGFIIDFIFRKSKKEKIDYHICNEEHCHCEKNIFLSTIKHTLNTILFIFLASFIINIIMHYLGEEKLSRLFLKNNIFAPFIISIIGLIPNCSASIIITELFLNNLISFGTLISGLLTGSGVALLVLFKTNKNLKENIGILSLVYLIGSMIGFLIELIKLIV